MSKIQIKCPKCGNSTFKAPINCKLTDKVTCIKCGFTNTHQRIVAPVGQKYMADEVKKMLAKALKGLK